jgi:hypothetical protein
MRRTPGPAVAGGSGSDPSAIAILVLIGLAGLGLAVGGSAVHRSRRVARTQLTAETQSGTPVKMPPEPSPSALTEHELTQTDRPGRHVVMTVRHLTAYAPEDVAAGGVRFTVGGTGKKTRADTPSPSLLIPVANIPIYVGRVWKTA